MSRASDIKRLADLGQLVLDHRLGQLRRVAADLERSRMLIAALDQSGGATDLEPLMAEKVALSYNRWAEERRSELNLVMARQTADWIEARSEAQMALGRVQALEGLAARLRQKR
jgi:hypothetical protein